MKLAGNNYKFPEAETFERLQPSHRDNGTIELAAIIEETLL
jgi:hypothetical protein